jgi:hypothetical protein
MHQNRLGYVPAFYSRPMLEEVDWAHRIDLKNMVQIDYWTDRSEARVPSS